MNSFKKNMLLILSCFTTLIYSQNNEEKYLITYLEKRQITEEGQEHLKKLPYHIQELLLTEVNEGKESFLFIDNKTSVYSVKNRTEPLILEGTLEREVKFIKSETDYFKDDNNELLIIKTNKDESEYVVKTDLHPINWIMLDESKEINSMICKKATGKDMRGNEIEAWYTETVSISNGPAQYGGLPGLIVQLKDKNRIFELTEIEKTNTENKIDFPNMGNAITIEEYYKIFFEDKGITSIKRNGR